MARPFTQYDQFIESTQNDTAVGPNEGAPMVGNNMANNSGSDLPIGTDVGDRGDDRPIQDNGTQNAHFSCGGLPYTPGK